jgi:hypothetical protein
LSIESGGGREAAGGARSSCWASPRLIGKICDDKGGRGIIAATAFEPGELIALFGGAPLIAAQLGALSADERRRVLQVDEDLYLLSEVESMADWVNHSCEPNAGLRGQIALIARRPIKAGEEISYDYAMSDGSPYDGFACRCGAATCRGQVTGDDWKLEPLWARYDGEFSPYLAARIARLRKRQTARRPRALAAVPR